MSLTARERGSTPRQGVWFKPSYFLFISWVLTVEELMIHGSRVILLIRITDNNN
jgi:hypothetical protein